MNTHKVVIKMAFLVLMKILQNGSKNSSFRNNLEYSCHWRRKCWWKFEPCQFFYLSCIKNPPISNVITLTSGNVRLSYCWSLRFTNWPQNQNLETSKWFEKKWKLNWKMSSWIHEKSTLFTAVSEKNSTVQRWFRCSQKLIFQRWSELNQRCLEIFR